MSDSENDPDTVAFKDNARKATPGIMEQESIWTERDVAWCCWNSLQQEVGQAEKDWVGAGRTTHESWPMTVLCSVPGSAHQLSSFGGKARLDLKFEQRTTDKVFQSSGTLALLLRCRGVIPGCHCSSQVRLWSSQAAEHAGQKRPSCMSHHRGCQFRGDTAANLKVV